jgi:hypothetical protein
VTQPANSTSPKSKKQLKTVCTKIAIPSVVVLLKIIKVLLKKIAKLLQQIAPKLKTEWILFYLENVSAFCATDALLPSFFGNDQ